MTSKIDGMVSLTFPKRKKEKVKVCEEVKNEVKQKSC